MNYVVQYLLFTLLTFIFHLSHSATCYTIDSVNYTVCSIIYINLYSTVSNIRKTYILFIYDIAKIDDTEIKANNSCLLKATEIVCPEKRQSFLIQARQGTLFVIVLQTLQLV